jgi:hypothetical protein
MSRRITRHFAAARAFRHRAQFRRPDIEYLKLTTYSNSSVNFAVATPAAFAVGEQRQFSASANGFTAGTNYFVLTVASTCIQVASSQNDSPIVATGATAVIVLPYLLPQPNAALVDTFRVPLALLPSQGFTIDRQGT